MVGSVVKAEVGEMEDNTKEVRIMRTSNEVVGCVQDVVNNRKLLVQFYYEKKKDMSCVLLSYVCSKGEVCHDMDEPISYLPEK